MRAGPESTCGHVVLVAQDRTDAVRWQAASLDPLRRHARQNLDEFVGLWRGGITIASGHNHRACAGYLRRQRNTALNISSPIGGSSEFSAARPRPGG